MSYPGWDAGEHAAVRARVLPRALNRPLLLLPLRNHRTQQPQKLRLRLLRALGSRARSRILRGGFSLQLIQLVLAQQGVGVVGAAFLLLCALSPAR